MPTLRPAGERGWWVSAGAAAGEPAVAARRSAAAGPGRLRERPAGAPPLPPTHPQNPTQVAGGGDHHAVPREALLHLGPQQRLAAVARRQPAPAPRQVLRVGQHLVEAAPGLDAAAHGQLAVALEQHLGRPVAQEVAGEEQRRRAGGEGRQAQQRGLDGAVGRVRGEERRDQRRELGPAPPRLLQVLPPEGQPTRQLVQGQGRGVNPGQGLAGGQPGADVGCGCGCGGGHCCTLRGGADAIARCGWAMERRDACVSEWGRGRDVSQHTV
jgi:hypothetical protein